jgi:hypothetical protein
MWGSNQIRSSEHSRPPNMVPAEHDQILVPSGGSPFLVLEGPALEGLCGLRVLLGDLGGSNSHEFNIACYISILECRSSRFTPQESRSVGQVGAKKAQTSRKQVLFDRFGWVRILSLFRPPSGQIVHPSRVFKLAPIYSRILGPEIFPNHLGTGQTVKIEGTFDHTRGPTKRPPQHRPREAHGGPQRPTAQCYGTVPGRKWNRSPDSANSFRNGPLVT